jgi:hypothetical protein
VQVSRICRTQRIGLSGAQYIPAPARSAHPRSRRHASTTVVLPRKRCRPHGRFIMQDRRTLGEPIPEQSSSNYDSAGNNRVETPASLRARHAQAPALHHCIMDSDTRPPSSVSSGGLASKVIPGFRLPPLRASHRKVSNVRGVMCYANCCKREVAHLRNRDQAESTLCGS